MKYIVYRGLRHRNLEEYEYEEGKMELTLTILSKDDSYWGRYCAPIFQKKKPTLKQIENIWEIGAIFENTREIISTDFTLIFSIHQAGKKGRNI